ncbi:hypothetical protein ACLOJK_015177 [Asimina triloba]
MYLYQNNRKEEGGRFILRSDITPQFSESHCTSSQVLHTQKESGNVRIVCGVDHDDLKQLFHVSKTIREASFGQAIVAKQTHFAFSTPSSKNSLLKPFSDLEDGSKFEEAPDAPRQPRQYRSRFGSKKLAEISVALFAKMEM